MGRVVVYLGLGGIWWLTLDAPPWRYLLAGILLWECYCLIAAIVMGLRGHSFRVRLSKVGILTPSEMAGVSAQVLSWIGRKKLAVADRSGNLCSTKFLDTVCRHYRTSPQTVSTRIHAAVMKVWKTDRIRIKAMMGDCLKRRPSDREIIAYLYRYITEQDLEKQ